MGDQTKEDMKATIKAVRDRLRVTKVVCTRAVKGRSGDSFAGFSAAWDTTQDDGGGQGADLIETIGEDDAKRAASQGMTLKEARIAAHLLGMQADVTAFEHAAAGSILKKHECDRAVEAIKFNYGQLMAELLGGSK